MVKRYFYDSGLGFSESLVESLDSINDRVVLKKAAMVIVDGGIGEGKTTFGVQICKYGEKTYNNQEFDMSKQIGMGGSAFLKAADWCRANGKRFVIYDEAGDLSRRGSLTDFNRNLNRFFETYRQFAIIPILCLPAFTKLDKHMFDLRVPRILLHCYKRTANQGNFKMFSLAGMYMLINNDKNIIIKPKLYTSIQPVIRGHFLDLPPEQSKELEELSMKGKQKILIDTHTRMEGIISVKEIADKLNTTPGYINVKISRKGIMPREVIGKAKYYDKNIINDLAS